MAITSYALPDLYPWQREVRDSPARHHVVYAGRRAGKTRLAVAECFAVGLMGGRALWAAPTNPLTDEGWEKPSLRWQRACQGPSRA